MTSITPEPYVGGYRANPWTLVYQGAITTNAPDAVNIHPVTYKVGELTMAANVYTPAGYEPSGTYAAIAVAHPNGGVKEQVSGLFAQRLAELGYIAIAADAAYQGASQGYPRQTDKPAHRVQDIHGMADFLTTFPGVDIKRIGLLGICGGGGYSIKAAQTDKRFTAVATLSMFNSGLIRRNGLNDSAVDTIAQRLREASDARTQEAMGGLVQYLADGIPTDEQIAAMPEGSLYREGSEYYFKTHKHPRSSSRYTTSSMIDLVAFDARDQVELIDRPLLMMAGSKADTKYMSDDVFKRATGTQDKTFHVIEGASHIQTYWVPQYVDEAVEQLQAFYGTHLA